MMDLRRKGIALNFVIGLVLTLILVGISAKIFVDVFSYRSDQKAYDSFDRLVAMMKTMSQKPDGTRDSVLVRMPSGWAIAGFDNGPFSSATLRLESQRLEHMRDPELNRIKTGFVPQECKQKSRCICLVKGFSSGLSADNFAWAQAMVCKDLTDTGDDILLAHENFIGDIDWQGTAQPHFWHGGFAIIEDETDWNQAWLDPERTFTNQAASVAGAVYVEKQDGKINVCTRREGCATEMMREIGQLYDRTLMNFQEYGQTFNDLQERRTRPHDQGESDRLRHEYGNLALQYNLLVTTKSHLLLTPWQQDVVLTRRAMSAVRGDLPDSREAYVDEALSLVKDAGLHEQVEILRTQLAGGTVG